jgi:hypothetical protein
MARLVRRSRFLVTVLHGGAPAEADVSELGRQVAVLPLQSDRGQICCVAEFAFWGDLQFLDTTASRFLKLDGNPPYANNSTVTPVSLGWFAIPSFNSTGYVRDDEKREPDQLLAVLQRQYDAGIAERQNLASPLLGSGVGPLLALQCPAPMNCKGVPS